MLVLNVLCLTVCNSFETLTDSAGKPGAQRIALQFSAAVAHSYLNILKRLMTCRAIDKSFPGQLHL